MKGLSDKKGILECLSVNNTQESSSPTAPPISSSITASFPPPFPRPFSQVDINRKLATSQLFLPESQKGIDVSTDESILRKNCTCKSSITSENICASCPIFDIIAQEEILITDLKAIGEFQTILCVVRHLPYMTKSVKVFKDSTCFLNGNGFISSVSSEGKLFLTFKTTISKLQRTWLSVSKGDKIAECQISNLPPPPDPEARVEVAIVEAVDLPPGQVTTVELKLSKFNCKSPVKPEILLLHFSTLVPARPNLVMKKGRVSLQKGNIFLLPIHNRSEECVHLKKDLEFGIVQLFFNSHITEFEKVFNVDTYVSVPKPTVILPKVEESQVEKTVLNNNETSFRVKVEALPYNTEYSEPLKSEPILELETPTFTDKAEKQVEKVNELLVFISLDLFEVGSGSLKMIETKTISVQVDEMFKSYFVTPSSFIRHCNSKELVKHGYQLTKTSCFLDCNQNQETVPIKMAINNIVDLVKGVQSSLGISKSSSSLVFKSWKECTYFIKIAERFAVPGHIRSIITRVCVTIDEIAQYWPSPDLLQGFNTIAKSTLTHESAFYEVTSTPFSDTNLQISPARSIPLSTSEQVNSDKNHSLKRRLERNPVKSKRLRSLATDPKSICACSLHTGDLGKKICSIHKSVLIKSLVQITIQPNTIETILCRIQSTNSEPDSRSMKSIKVFPLQSFQPSSFSLCFSSKPRLVYDNKVYLTLRNLGWKPFVVRPGVEYAVGNEVLVRTDETKDLIIQVIQVF